MNRKGDTTVPVGSVRSIDGEEKSDDRELAAITLEWNENEPERVGESAVIETSGVCFVGRSDKELDDVGFSRVRGGESTPTGALSGDTLSRQQVALDFRGDVPRVERVGRLAMRVDGVETKSAELTGTHVIEIVGHSTLLYRPRPRTFPRVAGYPVKAFGEADALGIVGEGPEAWRLRARIAFVGAFDEHVMVHGETGTGKELVAHGVHAISKRAGARFVDCNVAAIAPTLVSVILGGNRKDWPNVGTPERVGLLEEAAKGTLFLDEVGAVEGELLAAFLRAMDPGASYQRGGDSHSSRADVRFVCATNKPLDGVLIDFVERCPHEIAIPSLAARREDIPLLVRHLLLSAASVVGSPAQRFVYPGRRRHEIRVDQELMTSLLLRTYPGNVRALAKALRAAMADSRGKTLRLRGSVVEAFAPTVAAPVARVTKADACAAVERNFGNVSAAARELRLTRDVMRGLLK
ncbi:MAG TPA: sigma 54-interacting transcriptional regulator [Polyangiaceae bacterium]|jgi:two-component system nitrogen regulation response regulator GlnG/two-component system response regulator HydG|nr:sigma 54-interacting transcriptional regulator [Polyangiaceae bacterium]